MRFPAPAHSFPTKDEMADYLEEYVRRFDLPVRSGVEVTGLTRQGDRFLVSAGDQRFEADDVVVAMSSWQRPRLPRASARLSEEILQLHSAAYRNPGQLRDGDVLVVGAGNSGAEIALDVANGRRTLLAGPDTGHVPFRVEGMLGRLLMPIVGRIVFHRLLTLSTPIGRRARPKMVARGEPLVRVKPKDLAAAGIERVPRVTDARDGLPLLEDGGVAEVANVIWCTGFLPSFAWVDLPVFTDGQPDQDRGIVPSEPGLYFVGLKFLYAVSSAQIHGVGRDARRIAELIAARHRERVDAGR
jgi:putative flavoprotein involved in K+ transport